MNRTTILVLMMFIPFYGAACHKASMRPDNLPEFNTHQYKVIAQDPFGEPVEGVTIFSNALDLSDNTESNDKCVTGSDGSCTISVSVQLTQYWSGWGYYPADIESKLKELLKNSKFIDIWGYSSQIKLKWGITETSPHDEIFKAAFNADPNPLIIDPPLIIKVPFTSRPKGLPDQNIHEYHFIAMDKFNSSVQGASIVVDVSDSSNSNDQSQYKCITDSSGMCSISIPTRLIQHFKMSYSGADSEMLYNKMNMQENSSLIAIWGYLTNVHASAKVKGFYPGKVVEEATFHNGREKKIIDEPIVVYVPLPTDYICDELKIKHNYDYEIAKFISNLQFEGLKRKVILEKICHQNYKKKKYLSLSLISVLQYNELRLSNYAIGVLIFDDIIRKMIRQLNYPLPKSPIDGYLLSISTQKGNPLNDNYDNDKKELVFDFYLPIEAVKKYIIDDISGQKLVDESIILLNNERIDLILQ